MSKSIILCCDGTNNQMTGHETNVLRLFRALKRDENQIAFYDPGVGTLADPMTLTRMRKSVQRSLDAAIGRSLCHGFSDAYRFLVEHYKEGDQVFLFGFSRGAYTARAVAGALQMLGLLRPELAHLAPYVWAVYSNDGGAYDLKSRFGSRENFRKWFCIPQAPRIRCMGLWDTVSSFGWLWNFQSLPFTANNPSIDQVRHAVSIDERRAAFPTNLFYNDGKATATETIKQVWFAGVHSDIGGGYVDKEAGLSKVAFEWMIQELEPIGDIRLEESIVQQIVNPGCCRDGPDPIGQLHNSLGGLWHLLEWLPRRQWKKSEADVKDPGPNASAATATKKPKATWEKRWMLPHLYARRVIPSGSWIHPSVFARMDEYPNYRPKLPSDHVRLKYSKGRGFIPDNKS